MRTAYDPVRVQQLLTHTTRAIDELARIRCNDPAAADAVRSVRLTRVNLEDLWVPLLLQIRASRAMSEWVESTRVAVERGHEMIVDWIADRRPAPDEYARMTDDDLLAYVEWFAIDDLPFDDAGQIDPADPFWTDTFAALAGALAARVQTDAGFGDRLLDLGRLHPVVGFSVGHADFPAAFVERLARHVLVDPSGFDGYDTRALGAAASTVLGKLSANPARCLSVLRDRDALATLARWEFLDPEVVAAVFHAGLYVSVAQNPRRLDGGYEVLAELTRLAGELPDGGFTAGASRGIANSLIGYIDTLAPAVVKEDGGPVRVRVFEYPSFAVELGTYEDVRGLIGAISRDAEAQSAIGVTLGAYMNSIVDVLGTDVSTRSGVEHVAQFADLVGDAVTAEQAEMIAAAAEESAQRRLLAGMVGFGIGNAAVALGAGGLVTYAVGQLVRTGSDRFADVEPDTMPNGLLRHVTYDAIVVAAVTVGRRTDVSGPDAADPEDRDDPDDLARVDACLARIASLESAGAFEAYRREVADLARLVETTTPNLDRFVNSVTNVPAVSELTESH